MEKIEMLSDYIHMFIRIGQHTIGEKFRTGSETAVVGTAYGKVKGIKRSTIYGVEYFSFEKIPYGKPPINELRFKAPQPPVPWKGVLDCTRGNVRPYQKIITCVGSEDCLYLNVYTNNLETKTHRPVMIWIHGGNFKVGEATRYCYGPDLLVEKDIVLVTVNYRIGPLGFLSLNDPELGVPGNAGLKDIVLSIKWVKENCSNFGGNPDNITVFGSSSGSASTGYMFMTDQTKDLFHKAILMSGCVTAEWALMGKDNYAYQLAKEIGYSGEKNEKDILKFLSKVEAHNLVGLHDKILTEEELLFGINPFGPVIEPYITKDCVIPKSPNEMLKTAWGNKIPIMVGCTSFEGLLFYRYIKRYKHVLRKLDTCTHFIPEVLVTDRDSSEAIEMGQKIKKAHFDEKSSDPLTAALDILSFKYFYDPLNRFLLARHKYSDAPTYLYRFDFESTNLVGPNYIMRSGKDVKGVGHIDDIAYLFNSFMSQKVSTKSREYKTIQRMTALWTHFAKTGNPNSATTKSVMWNPTTKDDKTHVCLNISDKLKVKKWPEMRQAKVWQSLYPEELL